MKTIRAAQIAIAISLGLLVLAGCGGGDDKVTLQDTPAMAQETPAQQNQNETVDLPVAGVSEFGTARELEAVDSYKAVGSFTAYRTITVSPKVAGTLTAVPMEEGDRVRPDTVVARVDTEDYQLALASAEAQLAVAEANLKNARNEYERKQKLYKENAIPASTFEQFTTSLELAEAQRRNAEVALERAQKELRDAVTPAGVSGVVSRKFAEKGEFIDSGNPVVEISVVEPIKLVFSVPQQLAAQVSMGAEVSATLTAFPGRRFRGTVSLVSPTLDARTRTVPIEAKFDNAEGLLKPGFFAECIVGLARSNRVFVVPNAALFSTEQGLEVHVKTDNGERAVPVFLVQRIGEQSQVTGDIEDGATLLLQY
jgi:membrane fusion protein, multidrug efflux system